MLIVQLLISCSDIGFSLNRHETLDVVASYLEETKQEKLFKNSRPSDDWYYDFIARHKKELAIRNCSNMPCNRAMSCSNHGLIKLINSTMRKIFMKSHAIFSTVMKLE